MSYRWYHIEKKYFIIYNYNLFGKGNTMLKVDPFLLGLSEV